MKKKPFFTVMIIPHTEHGPKSIRIPVSLIRILSMSLILALMYSFMWMYHYTYLKNEYLSLKAVQDENQMIIDEYSKDYLSLYQDIKTLKAKMMAMQELEQEIRVKNGFDPTKSYFSKQNQSVLSKIEDKSKMTASTLQIQETKETVETLKEAIPEKKESLDELIQLLEDKNETLSSVPSIYPTVGRITSRFGYRRDPFTGRSKFHEGIDIANAVGTPIYSTADGVVTFSDQNGGYGKQIIISHGNGFVTVYAHNYKNLVDEGDIVKKGQLIAYLGNTGRSTGPHLHYEVRKNGKVINPINYFN